MTPPGLGFVSVSERAMRMHEESRMPRYYSTGRRPGRPTRRTRPRRRGPRRQLIIQLDVALRQLLDEGIENALERHVC